MCDSQAHNFLSVLSDQKKLNRNKIIFYMSKYDAVTTTTTENMFHKIIFCDMRKKDFHDVVVVGSLCVYIWELLQLMLLLECI